MLPYRMAPVIWCHLLESNLLLYGSNSAKLKPNTRSTQVESQTYIMAFSPVDVCSLWGLSNTNGVLAELNRPYSQTANISK